MKVNGKIYAWEEGLTIEKLLRQLGFTHPGIILSVNDVVIQKGDYQSHILDEKDAVKIVHPLVGG